jgi:hypothetical protein
MADPGDVDARVSGEGVIAVDEEDEGGEQEGSERGSDEGLLFGCAVEGSGRR